MEDQALEMARLHLSHGDLNGAVRWLKQALTEDPDLAHTHALLSRVLLAQKRLYAASHEADLALTLDPEEPLAHEAAARVAIAQRRFPQAQEHIQWLLETDPEGPDHHRLQATLHDAMGQRHKRRAALERALQLDATDPHTLERLADEALDRGDVDAAEQFAREALQHMPEFLDALVTMGRIHVSRNQLDLAKEHAIQALHLDATDPDALMLLASIKARESLLMGCWWRLNTWANMQGERGTLLFVLGTFVAYRFASIALNQANLPQWASVLQSAWMAFVLYTWVAPAWFKRMVDKELHSVTLRPGF